jgi:hypothetical protein
MRTKDKNNAIVLRKQGRTYSEIVKTLHVAKSTLSDWLKNYPFTKNQIHSLRIKIHSKRVIGIKKTIITKRHKKLVRIKEINEIEKKVILPISKREFYIAGLMLYMGEGRKGDNSTVSLNNTDPKVVILFLHWLVHILMVPKERIRVIVHLYKDMNINKSLDYWSTYLSIPRKQFIKPYIKQSVRQQIDQKGYGQGTCGLYIYDRKLKLKILAGIDAIASDVSRMV